MGLRSEKKEQELCPGSSRHVTRRVTKEYLASGREKVQDPQCLNPGILGLILIKPGQSHYHS